MATGITLSHDEIVRQLKYLTKDLFYVSESDYPLEVVVLNKIAVNMPVQAAILTLTGLATAPIQEETLPYFFRNMTNVNSNANEEVNYRKDRFRLLQDFMERHLQDLKVYRVGKREIKAYALGKTFDDYYAGFKTIVVET